MPTPHKTWYEVGVEKRDYDKEARQASRLCGTSTDICKVLLLEGYSLIVDDISYMWEKPRC